MRGICLASSFVLILGLILILLLGAVVHDPDSIRPILDGLVHAIHLNLIVSSALLGIWFWRIGLRALGIVFGLNLVAIAISAGLRLAGLIFPPLVLFGADLYWLNLYLVCLAWHGGSLYRGRG